MTTGIPIDPQMYCGKCGYKFIRHRSISLCNTKIRFYHGRYHIEYTTALYKILALLKHYRGPYLRLPTTLEI